MHNRQKAFYKNAFDINEFGNGGEKRSFQIHDLFTESHTLIFTNDIESHFAPIFQRYWSGFQFLVKHRLPLRSLKQISVTGFKVQNFLNWMKLHDDVRFFIWEPNYSYDDFHIPLLCKKYGIKSVVFPHNIESLVDQRKSEISGKVAPTWLPEELKILKQCDSVFTISLEEQWLLNAFNIQSTFLQYFPSINVFNQFKRIRTIRDKEQGEEAILMFGTALNPPTFQGMVKVLEFIIERNLKFQLNVAGYGTEKLLEYFDAIPQNIKIFGALEKEALENHLTGCKCVLIYQNQGTGALTKIQELMIGGIPMLINTIALRSYHNINGIFSFQNLEFLNAINTINISPPKDIEEDYIHHMKIKQLELLSLNIN